MSHQEPAGLIPDQLLANIKKGDCVLFLGADLPLNYPGAPFSRPELAAALAQKYGLPDDQPWPDTAQAYLGQHTGDRHGLISFVAERCSGPAIKPGPLHQVIAKVGFRAIVTAWYDEVLEEALRQAGYRVNRVVRDTQLAYAGVGERETMVIKLFGCLSDPESLTLTTQDQARLLARLSRKLQFVHVDLSEADLGSIDFREASLNEVNFTGTDLRNADFRGARLREVCFCDCDLTGANFAGSICLNIDVSEAEGFSWNGATWVTTGDGIKEQTENEVRNLLQHLSDLLNPLLPFLLAVLGKSADKIGENMDVEIREKIWKRLYPAIEADPFAKEIVFELTQTPTDEDLKAMLQTRIKKILKKEPTLTSEIVQLLESAAK